MTIPPRLAAAVRESLTQLLIKRYIIFKNNKIIGVNCFNFVADLHLSQVQSGVLPGLRDLYTRVVAHLSRMLVQRLATR